MEQFQSVPRYTTASHRPHLLGVPVPQRILPRKPEEASLRRPHKNKQTFSFAREGSSYHREKKKGNRFPFREGKMMRIMRGNKKWDDERRSTGTLSPQIVMEMEWLARPRDKRAEENVDQSALKAACGDRIKAHKEANRSLL